MVLRVRDMSPAQLRARRDAHLRRTYGLTLADYERLFAEQGGVCAICEREPRQDERAFAVDHDHKSNVVRGILCSYCNHRVVGRHTDGVLLRKVADYLERDTGFRAPEKKRRVKRPRRKRERGN